MKGWQRTLLRIKLVHDFIEWTKATVLPGFSPLPIYTIAYFFIQEVSRESLATKASSLAYNFMLAIFPGSIFLCTLIPYFPASYQNNLMTMIAIVMPDNAFKAVEATLAEIIKKQNGGLLSFGFLTAVIFATNGLHRLMMAFNKSSLIIETRSWLKQRLVAFYLTVVIVLALLVTITAMIAGEYILLLIRTNTHDLNLRSAYWDWLIDAARWFTLVVVYFVTISVLYRYGPSNPKKWRLFSAGSWLATLLAVLTFWGFAFYIRNFGAYNKLYGSIGTLIVVMIWLYLNSLIILIGFELNASIDLSKRSIRIVKPRVFNSFKEPVEDRLEQANNKSVTPPTNL